ncbi:hypothetical protein [Mycolicibacterium sp. HS_4_1]
MSQFTQKRARVGGLTRTRAHDDPDLRAARSQMQDEILVDAIAKALANSRPLTAQTRERIVELLAAEAPP